jgi:UPF0716 family protein affecting phage T7 exclusion
MIEHIFAIFGVIFSVAIVLAAVVAGAFMVYGQGMSD